MGDYTLEEISLTSLFCSHPYSTDDNDVEDAQAHNLPPTNIFQIFL